MAEPATNVQDPLQEAFQVFVHIVIAKPQHGVAEFLKSILTSQVLAFLRLVRSSVQFHNQSRFCAVEIRDERIDHVLTPKLKPAEFSVS
jgi:hypothetical protein